MQTEKEQPSGSALLLTIPSAVEALEPGQTLKNSPLGKTWQVSESI